MSTKRVVNFPFFTVKERSGIKVENFYTSGVSALEKLINSCFETSTYEEEDLQGLLLRADMPVETAKELEDEAKPHRHKFNRCRPNVTNEREKYPYLDLGERNLKKKIRIT